MVPSNTVDWSAVLCARVVVVEVFSMSEVTVLASTSFFGFGVFSSSECAASPSESSSFQTKLCKGVFISNWFEKSVTLRC